MNLKTIGKQSPGEYISPPALAVCAFGYQKLTNPQECRQWGGCACEMELESGQHKQRVMPFTTRQTVLMNALQGLRKAGAIAGKMSHTIGLASSAGSSSGAHPTETPNTSSTASRHIEISRKWAPPQGVMEKISPNKT